MLRQTDHLPLTFTPDADAGHHRVHGGSGLRAVQLQQHARRPHGKPHRALAACCRLTRSQVLQQGPKQAVVWGFGTPGANVTVSMTPQVGPVGFSVVDATGVWSAGIGPVEASEQAYVVTAVSGGETIMLQDVLFGDVWVSRGCCYAESTSSTCFSTSSYLHTQLCSGQSNMQFTVDMGFNATAEVAAAANFPLIRLYTAVCIPYVVILSLIHRACVGLGFIAHPAD